MVEGGKEEQTRAMEGRKVEGDEREELEGGTRAMEERKVERGRWKEGKGGKRAMEGEGGAKRDFNGI